MKIPLIDLRAQYYTIKEEIESAIQRVFNSTSFVENEEISIFENEFAKFCGVEYGVATSSGSTALDLCLLALGIGAGDEVITVPNTFIATTEAITHVGAKVVFTEIDPNFYNMDPRQIESKITSRTKALIPVHLFGQPCDMEPILEIARKHNILVIEDAAQSHGAKYKDKRVGGFGDAAIFSFYPSKNLGSYGQAGIVVTNDKKVAVQVKLLANHGRGRNNEHIVEGYNYRANALQIAILRVKFRYLEEWNEKRRKNAQIYNSLLKGIDIVSPKELPHAKHVYHLYVVKSNNRDKLLEWLNSRGIGARIHYPIPLYLQPAYRYLNLGKGSFPVTEKFCSQILSLPMYPELKREQIELVVQEIKAFLNQERF